MKKFHLTLTLTLLFSLMVITGCGGDKAPTAGSGGDANLLAMIPIDASGVFVLNVKEFSKLEIFNKMIEDFKKKEANPDDKAFKDYQDFVNMTGIDPAKDIHGMAFGIFGDINPAGAEPDFAAVLNISYDKDKILGLIKSKFQEKNKELKEEDYQGSTLFMTKDDKGKDVAFSFMSDKLIGIGKPAALKKIIDVSKGTVKSILDNEKVKPYLKEVAGKMSCFFFDFPEMAKKVHDTGMFKADLSKAELMFGFVEYKGSAWNGLMQIVSQNQEGNEQLVTTLNGLKGMANMAGPEYGELVNNINLSSTADAIKLSFTFSEELIQKIQKKVEEQQKGMMTPSSTDGN